MHCVLEFNQSQCLNLYVEFNTHKKVDAVKKWKQKWKSILQINEQCCTQKINGKCEKQN